MAYGYWTQDPSAILFYEMGCDVTQDTILTAAWTVSPAATLSSQTVFSSGTFNGGKVLVGPLTSGETKYKLTATLTGSSGQTYRNSIEIIGESQ